MIFYCGLSRSVLRLPGRSLPRRGLSDSGSGASPWTFFRGSLSALKDPQRGAAVLTFPVCVVRIRLPRVDTMSMNPCKVREGQEYIYIITEALHLLYLLIMVPRPEENSITRETYGNATLLLHNLRPTSLCA